MYELFFYVQHIAANWSLYCGYSAYYYFYRMCPQVWWWLRCWWVGALVILEAAAGAVALQSPAG